MKLTLQIDGETFEVEGQYFPFLLEELARKANMIEDNEFVRVLSKNQVRAADNVD